MMIERAAPQSEMDMVDGVPVGGLGNGMSGSMRFWTI
jgi:hypothetical protein